MQVRPGEVLHQRVDIMVIAVDAQRGVRPERGIDRGAGDHLLVVGAGQVDRAAELVEAGPHGDDVDDARGRVLAEQRALRAGQHLDPLDIDKVGDELAEDRAASLARDETLGWMPPSGESEATPRIESEVVVVE